MYVPTNSDIQYIRKNLNVTQAELAEKTGLSQSMISRIEAGTVDPRMSTFTKIVKFLNKRKKETIDKEE